MVENYSPLGRMSAIALLESGYGVAQVRSPEEVEPHLIASAVDVIVFNTGLPPEQKSVFIHGWRQMAPATKVLEVSENPLITSATGVDLSTIGAPDAFLLIPFLIDALPAAVEALLGGDGSANEHAHAHSSGG